MTAEVETPVEFPEDIRQMSNDIMDNACLGEHWVKNGVDAALREDISRAIADERERWEDKVDGLESDLDNAIEVAWNRGAEEWVRLNYPKHYERFSQREVKRTSH